MKAVIINSKCKLSISNNNLLVEKEDSSIMICLDDISILLLSDTYTNITAPLLIEMGKKQIPVVICDEKKNPLSFIGPIYGTINQMESINKQVKWKNDNKRTVSLSIIKNKIELQQSLIKHLFDIDNIYQDYLDDMNTQNYNLCEAFVARKYFYKLFGTKFNRRDYSNTINACLNYGYAILLSIINKEIISHGYLTSLGINHHSKTNNYNFSYDIIEPFRIFIDQFVFDNINLNFDINYKNNIVTILYIKIKYNNKVYTLIDSIKEYVNDVINKLNGRGEVGKIEFI